MKKWLPGVVILLILGACNRNNNRLAAEGRAASDQGQSAPPQGEQVKESNMDLADGVYARITSGDKVFLVQLYYREAPLTVVNFTGLAEGKISNTAKSSGQPYFDGLSWHRVVPGFVIQGGDPNGNGTGGPGYQFADEFAPGFKHDDAGILSMANAGPGTNGSQFFITLGPQPHLDGKHSVFGKVVQGAEQLAQVKQGDPITSIEILRVGADAQKFDNSQQAFDALTAAAKETAANGARQQWQASLEYARQSWGGDFSEVADDSGIVYWVTVKGEGKESPTPNSTVTAHYRLTVVDAQGSAQVIDESYQRGEPFTQPLNRLIPGWTVMLTQMRPKEKRAMVVPPKLGYGSRGAPPAIPPNSALVFEVELLAFN